MRERAELRLDRDWEEYCLTAEDEELLDEDSRLEEYDLLLEEEALILVEDRLEDGDRGEYRLMVDGERLDEVDEFDLVFDIEEVWLFLTGVRWLG